VTHIQNSISPIELILKKFKKFKYIFYCYRKLISKFYVHSIIFAILMAQNNFCNEHVMENRTCVSCNHLKDNLQIKRELDELISLLNFYNVSMLKTPLFNLWLCHPLYYLNYYLILFECYLQSTNLTFLQFSQNEWWLLKWIDYKVIFG